MLIPSIDLKGGRIVQLVQGERLAFEETDIFAWVGRFARFPLVQLIDLDAAIGSGANADLVADICRRLPCRVGGGVRSIGRARALLESGAREVIVGSALFASSGPDLAFAERLAREVGIDRLVGAVDGKGGRVVVHGWRTVLPVVPADAVRALEPFCGGFLYTHVDTEGLMRGIDMEAVASLRAATARRLTVAGGIRSREEIDALDRLGIDAVVGMAIYTGVLDIDRPRAGQ